MTRSKDGDSTSARACQNDVASVSLSERSICAEETGIGKKAEQRQCGQHGFVKPTMHMPVYSSRLATKGK